MELKLYNTLTRSKEVFRPIDPARVRMYVCGPTVYDFAHIGNARPVIVFDVLFRLLRHLYPGEGHVKYVRNVTDVDDKINARAAERGVSIRELTEETYANFKQDVAALGCLPPTVEPRATEHIGEMKTLIERLVAAGCAYVAEEHVLFHVASMKDYGKLSNRSLDEMVAGARVEVAPYKRDPMDFVLWKPSKTGEPGWPSPRKIKTPGRPGWHIECSAMSWKHLGETFDIHGGGIDLVFPHHENELAQSRCAFHSKVMANVWMHNGFLQVEGEKMSKSLGNFITIRQLLDRMPGDVVRLQMLMTHYRQPLDWTEDRIGEASVQLMKWADAVEGTDEEGEVESDVLSALCDDLNTSEMLKSISALADKAHAGNVTDKKTLRSTCKFLGFKNLNHPGYFQRAVQGVSVPVEKLRVHNGTVAALRAALANGGSAKKIHELKEVLAKDHLRDEISQDGWITIYPTTETSADVKLRVEALIEHRKAARARRDFQESDRIRDALLAIGIVLKDNKDGTTTWEVAR